jgi:hypothetical protein
MTATTALNGGATRIVRGMTALAVGVGRHSFGGEGHTATVTAGALDGLGRSRLTIALVAGLALVVTAEHRPDQLLLMAALAASDCFDGFGVGQVALAAALDGREPLLAVALLVIFVALETCAHREFRGAVRHVAIATVDLGVSFDRGEGPLLTGVATLTVGTIDLLASGEGVTLGALERASVQGELVLRVAGNATFGARRRKGRRRRVVALVAKNGRGPGQMDGVQGVLQDVGPFARRAAGFVESRVRDFLGGGATGEDRQNENEGEPHRRHQRAPPWHRRQGKSVFERRLSQPGG